MWYVKGEGPGSEVDKGVWFCGKLRSTGGSGKRKPFQVEVLRKDTLRKGFPREDEGGD